MRNPIPAPVPIVKEEKKYDPLDPLDDYYRQLDSDRYDYYRTY